MSRGSSAPVESHSIPAIVESPTSETAGASGGGFAAASTLAALAIGNDEASRTATVATTRRRRPGLIDALMRRGSGESDMSCVATQSARALKLTRSSPHVIGAVVIVVESNKAFDPGRNF